MYRPEALYQLRLADRKFLGLTLQEPPRKTRLLQSPEIQEEILFLPRTERGCDPIREHAVRPIAAEVHWGRQRRMWEWIRQTTT